MIFLLCAGLVAAAIVWGCRLIAGVIAAGREADVQSRTLQLLSTFAPGVGAGSTDPRAILAWEPLARTARTLLPEEFARIDRAAGAAFPFGTDRIQAAHAQWTADWLGWERTHDAEYKLKAAAVEDELARSDGSALVRARLDAVEREKLDLYQRDTQRYASRRRQALAETDGHAPSARSRGISLGHGNDDEGDDMTGTIRTLRVDKGFGFIKDQAGKEYFFHQSAVYGEGLKDLREGDSVEFDVGEGPKGPRAENVRRTST